MPNIKSKPTKNSTTIRNSMIRDKNLKCMDRGMLVTLLSYGKNWKLSIKGLSTQMPDSEESIRKSLIRLEKAGYLVRTKIYENGRIVYNDYTFKDEKLTDEEISTAKNAYKRKSEPISDTIASEDINDDKMAVFAYDRKEVEKILYNNVSLRKLELFLADKYQGDYDFDKKEADATLNIIINEISSTKSYTMIKGERIPRNIVADTLIKCYGIAADTNAAKEKSRSEEGVRDMLDTPIEKLYILISRKAHGDIKPMYVHSFSPKALPRPDDNAPACEKLKFIRLQKGLTQAEAASIIGIDRSTYIRWEKGEISGKVIEKMERELRRVRQYF